MIYASLNLLSEQIIYLNMILHKYILNTSGIN